MSDIGHSVTTTPLDQPLAEYEVDSNTNRYNGILIAVGISRIYYIFQKASSTHRLISSVLTSHSSL